MRECGVNVDFVDARRFTNGDDYLYVTQYRAAPESSAFLTVPPQKLSAINGGQTMVDASKATLTTDSRLYAFSAVIPVPPVAGPAILRLQVRVTAGSVGVFITQPDDLSNVVMEVPVTTTTPASYVDIPVDDASRVTQVILRNLEPVRLALPLWASSKC